MRKTRLLTPGPTEVPPEVLLAMAEPVIHHRSAPARELFARVERKLSQMLFTARPVYVFTGSGTAGMEAAIVNHSSPGDEVVVIEGGKFGERWSELARAYGLTVRALRVEWGHALSPDELAAALRAHPATRAVLATHVETSTATLFDIAALGRVVRPTGALFVVDAISALGAVPLRMDAWGIDVVVSSSQKALMLPPGLTLVCVSERAEGLWEQARLPRYYLDLRIMAKTRRESGPPFTPAITLWRGLDKALELIAERGLETCWHEAERLARATRAGLVAMGLPLLSSSPAPCVTAARVPEGMDGRLLVERMRQRFNLFLAGGQGKLAGKIVRISHMGAVDRFDVLSALSALESVLRELGHEGDSGAGVVAATRALDGTA